MCSSNPQPSPTHSHTHCRFPGTNTPRHWSAYNNEDDCPDTWFREYGYIDIASSVSDEDACVAFNSTLTRGYQSVWHYAKWSSTSEECLILPPPPECIQAGWSRVNHLGNGRDGVPLNYTWRLPHFITPDVQKLSVLRIRLGGIF